MKYQMQTGNPVPPKKNALKYAFLKTMKVGDNILVYTENDARKLRDVMRKRGMKVVYRKVDNQGWKIWYMGDKS